MKRLTFLAVLLPFLAGCDVLKDRMGIPDPAKLEAEGKAIGSACRHAGRGLEDCYRLNPEADKPAVFNGWKEMNEYMLKNNMQAVAPQIPPEMPGEKKPAKPAKEADAHGEAADPVAGDKADAKAGSETTDAHAEAAKGVDKKADAKKATAKDDAHAAGAH